MRQAGRLGGRGDHKLTVGDVDATPESNDATSPVPLVKKLRLSLDRWNCATVIFLVIFEQDSPALVRVIVLKAVAWISGVVGPVELRGERLWP